MASSAENLAPDDVVDLKDLRFARVYPYLRQKGHEALPECVKLLPRIPNLADSDVPL